MPEEKQRTNEEIVSGMLEDRKNTRYSNATKTLFGKHADRLAGQAGLSEGTRRDVFAGNATDKADVLGMVLSQLNFPDGGILKPAVEEETQGDSSEEDDSEGSSE